MFGSEADDRIDGLNDRVDQLIAEVDELNETIAQLRAAVRAADAMVDAVPTSSLCRLEDEHGENLMPFTDAVAAYREARRKCGEVT